MMTSAWSNVSAPTSPRFAILSHTWEAEHEEVTFRDLVGGTGKNKAGYRKLAFCGEQAPKGDIQYLWVDACCIWDCHLHRDVPYESRPL